MKTILFTIVCVLLALMLVCTIVGFSVKIEQHEEANAVQMSSMEASLSAEIREIKTQLSEMENQNTSLFREIRYEYKDVNAEKGNAVLYIVVYPKVVSETMTVEVGFEGMGMMEMDRYEGQFSLPLEVDLFGEYGAIYLNVSGENVATGLEKTDIPTKDIWRRFIPMLSVKFTGDPKVVDGNISLYGGFAYDKEQREKRYDTVGNIENVIIYVKKNGDIIERIYESHNGDQTHGCPVEAGDVISLSARVTDSYGFTYEYVFDQYIIRDDLGFIKVYTYSTDADGEPYSIDYITVWGSTDVILFDYKLGVSYNKK